MAAEEMQEITERYFGVYGLPLTLAPYFKYHGQIITTLDDDWPELVINLRKEQKKWDRKKRIYGQEGRRNHAGVGKFIQGSSEGSSYFWVGNVGDEHPRRMGHGGVLT